ncbi:MAG: hypothetical protein E6G19_11285 [Actinobacteria bacterium]|nr:MAG: hypothetical protein E6G19_11285 [Actinomycetota bacterium]
MSSDRFAHDKFLIEQLVRPIVNLYRVTPLAAGEAPAGGPVAFVRQKRMAIKEDIRFYADEGEQEELFRIKARSFLDTGGARYDVAAAEGSAIGVLHHQLKSLVRSTWRVTNADDQEVVVAQERSLPMAIARRVVDFVPYGEWVPIPYNFDLLSDGRTIGHLSRKFQLRDRYVLDVGGDVDLRLDRRLAIALAVGLDTLQNR